MPGYESAVKTGSERLTMKIVIVTDAWYPQVNGVVRTLDTVGRELRNMGYDIEYVTPEGFSTFPCPTYPEIRLAWFPFRAMSRRLQELQPDAIHIATEGPLGIAARRWCLKNGFPFTTSYHTQFPEYVRLRVPVPLAVSYAVMRWFHRPATRVMVATRSQMRRLEARGFDNVVQWARGVDTSLFRPVKPARSDMRKPVAVYVGRVAVEKNIEAFLSTDFSGTRLVIGDGPDLQMLMDKYPQAVYAGYRHGDDLVEWLNCGDVFVFPSLTDTFGLVMLEAMACGLPVAAYPVTGPIDVVQPGVTGDLDDDLQQAIDRALALNPDECVRYARSCSWLKVAEMFLDYLHIRTPSRAAEVISERGPHIAPAD